MLLAIGAACASAPAERPAEAHLAPPTRAPRLSAERGAAAAPPAAARTQALEPRAGEPWPLEAVLDHIALANPSIAGARASLQEAEAARREVAATYYPELSLGLDFLSTDNPAQAFALLLNQQELTLGPGFDATPGSTENWHAGLRLDWPLFAPGRGEQREAADEGEEAARLAAEAVERRLLNAGVQAWLGLRAARALEDVAAEAIEVVERRLSETRVRHEAGAALRADVLRLEVRLAAVRQEAAHARLVAREAESGLNRLMGRPAGAELVPEEGPALLGTDLPEGLDALLARAESERRDLQAMVRRARMAGLRTDGSRAARLPSVVAFGAYDLNEADPGFDQELGSYTVGVGVRLPLSPRTGPRILQAQARERRAREELRALGLDVAREVRDAWEGLRVAEETLALAAAAEGAAEEAFRIVAEAQDAGGATVTDVLEAEDARKSARVRHVAAAAGVEIARVQLVAATGGVR